MSRQDANAAFALTSFLYGTNASYIEDLYARYETDPKSVDAEWQSFFQSLKDDARDVTESARGPSWRRPDWPRPERSELIAALDGDWTEIGKAVGAKVKAQAQTKGVELSVTDVERATRDSVRALMLIRAYRARGHFHANLDPLGLQPPNNEEELDPSTYGFSEADLDRPIFLDKVLGLEFGTIRQIVGILRRTYCQTLGVEFLHISDAAQKGWIQERIEGPDKEITFTREGKRAILNKLVEAEGFEKFSDVKFTGTKRFGLDGGESMIPALEQIIKRGGALGVRDIVIGMAHRGRLNVLAQVMGKPHRAIFHEFKGGSSTPNEIEGSGDVKYHLGASSDREFDDNKVHLSLTANPSHLEIVDPVVLGKVRAKQDQHGATPEDRTHGDAAADPRRRVFRRPGRDCGVLRALRIARSPHRRLGAFHRQQSDRLHHQSALFALVAVSVRRRQDDRGADLSRQRRRSGSGRFRRQGGDRVPAEVPEAGRHRHVLLSPSRPQRGRRAVVYPAADVQGDRRAPHDAGNLQRQARRRRRRHRRRGGEDEGGLARAARCRARSRAELPRQQGRLARRPLGRLQDRRRRRRSAPRQDRRRHRGAQGRSATRSPRLPEGFHLHRTLNRFLENRRKSIESGVGIDWATGEALAFCSLLLDGHRVRLSGQDSERGTFSQRHSVLIDQETEHRYTPFNHLREGQARYEVINSMLSEEAVLGFEYGYSLAEPNALTLWEAQFGDFANGAQVLFDQFISSGERKWLRMSGLVCLLPHGYEGQGPEHSSARLERFLQMCAEDNMQVANCTTPANYFHILRRQLKRDFRKPLILMTPKSLLRHKRAVSRLDEMGPETSFHRLLWDDAQLSPNEKIKLVADDKIRRVVICSGKVYYDLYDEREKRGVDDIYLLRIEQLYPFPTKALMGELSRFKQAEIVWCQEEPRNQGGWVFVDIFLEWVLNQIGAKHRRARYAGRPASASTAVGQMSLHVAQLKNFLEEALS